MPPSHRSPRKSKPSFAIPADAVSAEKPVGWVYRAEEPAAQTPVVIPISSAPGIESPAPVVPQAAAMPAEPAPRAGEPPVSARPYHPAMIAGAGLFYLGVGSVALVSLTAAALIGKPFRMAKGLLGIG